MRRRTATVLIVTALTLAGCSSPDDSPPAKATATVTKTTAPKLSATEQRKACVSAWAKVLHDNADADQELDEPAACAGATGDRYGMYFDGMQQRNKENREAFDACTDDPSCTALPVP